MSTTTATPEQLAKLPKWAQEHIKTLETQRELTLRALNKFTDEQTESGIYVEDYPLTGEKPGGAVKRRYVQSTTLNIEHAGIHLCILLTRADDGQREHGVELKWSTGRRMHSTAALVPTGWQTAVLVSKKNMRE